MPLPGGLTPPGNIRNGIETRNTFSYMYPLYSSGILFKMITYMTITRATVKGQVIIPAPLRKKLNINKGTRIAIIEGEGNVIVLKPLPDDPIEASRGVLKGKTSMLKALLKDRNEEAKRG
jgi:AbrB family looped-hinge helix DNA binding protein